MHFIFSKKVGFCGRLKEDELVPSGDLYFRKIFAKCTSSVRVCGQRKHKMETSSTINELETTNSRDTISTKWGATGLCVQNSGTNTDYYLSQKSK